MELLILFLLAGMITGFLYRQKKTFIAAGDEVTTWSVYLLIFFLGASVGLNKEVMTTLHTLGGQALVLSVGSIVGSVIAAGLVYTLFFRGAHEK